MFYRLYLYSWFILVIISIGSTVIFYQNGLIHNILIRFYRYAHTTNITTRVGTIFLFCFYYTVINQTSFNILVVLYNDTMSGMVKRIMQVKKIVHTLFNLCICFVLIVPKTNFRGGGDSQLILFLKTVTVTTVTKLLLVFRKSIIIYPI